ncbi:hypothetical protein SAMN02983003_3174 [Devosia enhydra]|uniref:Uncharacterized protein n=1 Tax=Devosia enhydra TaxID=665118 RepID=A0A1K2I0U3_9HYPH|nr:hypothetical protein SAMN02983003_3174 [Devosia enhydra]
MARKPQPAPKRAARPSRPPPPPEGGSWIYDPATGTHTRADAPPPKPADKE